MPNLKHISLDGNYFPVNVIRQPCGAFEEKLAEMDENLSEDDPDGNTYGECDRESDCKVNE
jgi:hypothetical protein